MRSILAANWGKWLAEYFSGRRINNPFLLAANFGWRVVLESDGALMPARYAEWDGRERRIRLFLPRLRRFTNPAQALHYACAHELFHGLVAGDYRGLNLPLKKIPRLNNREEEIAAHAFSAALLNFHCEEKTCPPSASR